MRIKNLGKFLLCFFLISLLTPIFACKTARKITYKYADGNNNLYIIKKYTLEYKPIKPSESSSGTYSGGKYVKKHIPKTEYYRLRRLFYQAKRNKKHHTNRRIKGSGLLMLGSKYSVIIKANSSTRRKLEEALVKIKNG